MKGHLGLLGLVGLPGIFSGACFGAPDWSVFERRDTLDAGDCEAGTCCTDEDCRSVGSGNLACNTTTWTCFQECGPRGVDHDDRCADGYHCDQNVCIENFVGGACDEDSDCVSGECRNNNCCRHAGLCCAADEDCPDMFTGCATDSTQTCVFVLRRFPDTGLDGICYDSENNRVRCDAFRPGFDYYGQDGHYPGPPRSFTDLGDGRVRDDVTGRVWTKTVAGAMNWSEAQDHCRNLLPVERPRRLPLRYELQALVNYAPGGSGLDPPFEVPADTTLIWTGTSLAGAEYSTAWVVNVQDGTVQRRGKGSRDPRVLCVED